MPTRLDVGTPKFHFGYQNLSKSCLGSVLGVILAVLATLEGLWERLRLVLGRLEGILDRLVGILGASWRSGRLLGSLGSHLGVVESHLGGVWSVLGPKTHTKGGTNPCQEAFPS